MYEFVPPADVTTKEIDALLDKAFGPDRLAKTSYRFRQGVDPINELSMVALHGKQLVGTISYWPVVIGESGTPSLLLGPLAVEPSLRGFGIGVTLIRRTLAMARRQGHRIVVLVGDSDYYGRFGFVAASDHQIQMQGEPDRLMVRGLTPGALEGIVGQVLPWRDLRTENQAA